jgi:enoyl-CoA hydratase/carnithine racemase
MTSAYRTIRLERDGPLAWLVLDRPEVLNALSADVITELLDALGDIARSDARVVVLRGEGRAFSSGADLKSLATDVNLRDPVAVRRFMGRWRDVIMAIRNLPVPSVAAVAGPAYGGGCNLALACDVVIAAGSARFCQSYVDRNVTTDLGGSFIFPRLVGWGRARHLLLSGEVVDGETAATIGMAARSVADTDLLDTARSVALGLAEKDPAVVVAMRKLLDEGLEGTLPDALDREGDQVAEILSTPGFRTRLDEFLNSK